MCRIAAVETHLGMTLDGVGTMLVPLFLLSLAALSVGQDLNYANCSVAFYPKTACVNDGTRSNYIQFEKCDPSNTRVRSAWFDATPVAYKRPFGKNQDDYPISWQEIVTPKQLKTDGMLTVLYSRNNRFVIRAMQMRLPQCGQN